MNQKNDFIVAYCVSDKGDMPKELIESLKSINHFIDKNNTIVFYTSPYSQHNYDIFNKYAIVRQVPNVTPQFKYMKVRAMARYGEIIGHFKEIPSPNVFILDCDTIIKKDITELLDGNFDVAYRVATIWKDIDKQKWESLFKEHNKKPIVLPNKGFMLFKNNTHKKIANECMNYMYMDLPHVCSINYQKDQYALALAISGFKVRLWDKHTHAFQWEYENNVETFVLHGRQKNKLIMKAYEFLFRKKTLIEFLYV